jgi:hypothetical protein
MLQGPGRGTLPLPVPCLAWRESLVQPNVNRMKNVTCNNSRDGTFEARHSVVLIWRALAVAGDSGPKAAQGLAERH